VGWVLFISAWEREGRAAAVAAAAATDGLGDGAGAEDAAPLLQAKNANAASSAAAGRAIELVFMRV
jgi:hypothetical protein